MPETCTNKMTREHDGRGRLLQRVGPLGRTSCHKHAGRIEPTELRTELGVKHSSDPWARSPSNAIILLLRQKTSPSGYQKIAVSARDS